MIHSLKQKANRIQYFPACVLLLIFLIMANPALATVNINTADRTELQKLPGITAALAERIVDYRIEQGPFSDPIEIMNIQGIGPKTYDKVKDLISVDDGPTGSGNEVKSGSDASGETPPQNTTPPPSAQEILARFNDEPTVYEVQKAALEYAHIHSEDIRTWQKGVRRQALLPVTTFGLDYYNRESTTHIIAPNVTFQDEPDRFLIGPNDHTYYDYDYDYLKYKISFRWDLPQYIFDRADLSVRDEAEDLIDFRTEVVEDITKLYFERRRLQIELLLRPAKDLRRRIDQELRLQELTSLLDSLTGGYFLKKLEENKAATIGGQEGE